nr:MULTISPECIES: hypothetical protein [Thermotoga]
MIGFVLQFAEKLSIRHLVEFLVVDRVDVYLGDTVAQFFNN